MLDVSQRQVVIVGGGVVASRKVRGLMKAGASRIRVVSPAFASDLSETVERIQEPYRPEHLEGAELVFAATDDGQINESVLREARRLGILATRADADESEPGDFSTPAHFRDGPVVVSVAAGSAALAAAIRDSLAERFDARWSVMAELMQTLRPLILNKLAASPSRRTAVFRLLASEEALAVAGEGLSSLRQWLGGRYAELADE